MNIRCRYCEKEAVIRIPYAKLNLCVDHFNEFVVSKVRRTIERYKMISPGDKVLLAVSGGKDSNSLVQIMHKLSKDLNFKLIVLHIDLGIGEYSRRSREIVKDLCKNLEISCVIFDLKNDLGLTLPEFVLKIRTHRICSLCGTIKRYLMNAIAVELGVNSIATAHHADDVLTYIFKNFVLQDYTAMRKLLPVNKEVQGIVAKKIKPMYEVYEFETSLYVIHNNIMFVSTKCPYKKTRAIENNIKNFIEELEKSSPGIKISFLRKFAKTYMSKEEVEEFRRCYACGLASSKDVCSFCKLTEKGFGKPLGSVVREVVKRKLEEIML